MRTVLRILKWVAIVLAVVFIGIQFKRPVLSNPAVDQSQTIAAHLQVPSDVSSILERSCRDCHSNQTVWPWYTQLAPVSWWLANHVEQGRKDMNMSEWGKLPTDRQERKLRQMCDEVTDGQMPLSSYLPMHPTARLSEQDKKVLCDWTDQERQRLAGNAK